MERLLGDAETIARKIKERVRSEIELVASVGIAPTKFIAKIASDIRKPDGLFIVKPEAVLDFLHPLPVSRLWGVGKVTQEKLAALGLRYIGDVAAFPRLVLEKKLGANMGGHLHGLAQGYDSRSVEGGREMVSIGHEETFERDIGTRAEIANHLLRQADKVARRLRRRELRARTVVLKIKFADFQLVTRRKTLSDPSSNAQIIADTATDLLKELAISDEGGKSRLVRLCGVSVANLEDRNGPRQLGFAEAERARGERLGDVLDQIQDRFGDASVMRASHAKLRDD
jgi:DNA polymerase-4